MTEESGSGERTRVAAQCRGTSLLHQNTLRDDRREDAFYVFVAIPTDENGEIVRRGRMRAGKVVVEAQT